MVSDVLVHGSGFDPEFGSGHFRTITLPQMESWRKLTTSWNASYPAMSPDSVPKNTFETSSRLDIDKGCRP